jgi:sterol 3beta-glucosyltransferase
MSVAMSRVGAVKIYLVTLGSRGDNEPFLALATEAAQAGHEVFFSHTTDLPNTPDSPCEELALPGSFEGLISTQGVSITKALFHYKEVIKPLLEGVYRESTRQIRDIVPDVVVYHPKVLTAAVAAHSVGALAVIVEMSPTLTPTKEFPPAGLTHHLPGWLNKASYRLVTAALNSLGNPAKALAHELGVVGLHPDLTLCPVSPTLVPKPADWPEHAVVTGAWPTRQRVHTDSELDTFLSSGDVLYAGFGSMRDSHGATRADVIVAAARELGFKTLLVTGWGGLEASAGLVEAEDVLVRQSVDHHQVLPTLRVAIHHGGAGTTHAMLRAGVPSVVMPFLADQPWWAARLHRAGLGPAALSKKTRSVRTITKALKSAIKHTDTVAEASTSMAFEDGLGQALSVLESAEAGQWGLAPA